jgi:hypothetical protein
MRISTDGKALPMTPVTWLVDDDDYGRFFNHAETAKEAANLHADALNWPWGSVPMDSVRRCEEMDGLDTDDPLYAMMVGLIGTVECPGCGVLIYATATEIPGKNFTPYNWRGQRAHHEHGTLWCSRECAAAAPKGDEDEF